MKPLMNLGERLKMLRAERGLSQRALAQQAGLSTNSISLLERNEISPSVATLQSLARALGVRISYFFEDETPQSILHVKAADRSRMDSQGVSIENLGARINGQELEPFLIRLSPLSSSGDRQVVHTGHEMVFGLSGKFEYVIDGVAYLVEAEDFLLFDAGLPHIWRNPFEQPASFLLVLQTPGARLEPVKRHFVKYPSITHVE